MRGRDPVVSVIIPARNAASTIGYQLKALASQHAAPPFEVIVADNGSSDGTAQVVESFANQLDLKLVDASKRQGSAYARNQAVERAATPHLLFCDADDRVSSHWVAALHVALSNHELATGPVIMTGTSALNTGSDLSAPPDSRPRYRFLGLVPFAAANNLGLTAELFYRLGGFDCEMRYCQDADLTLRAQVLGAELGWVPEAVVFRRARPTNAAAALQHFRWGVYEAYVYKKLRRSGLFEGMKRPVIRPYLGLAARAYCLVTHRQRWWINSSARRAGRIVGSIRARVFCP
ncbi:MAG TPA: glycosyltransferase [Longimicrobiales bacterium]|nr:glycosyltransferase [Longimicrobiales bacterium]